MAKHVCPAGLPPWLATFADMMTLLMAFFVLLLSFAEIDAMKYRAVAGEMKKALGVKIDSVVETLPDGPKKEIQSPEDPQQTDCKPSACTLVDQANGEVTDSQFDLIKEELGEYAAEHNIIIRREEHKVLIRIQEQGVFASGSDKLSPVFVPIVHHVRETLAKLQGGIRVTGHSDDIPVSNGRFRSNWELSAARAVSVLGELLKDSTIEPRRCAAVGYGSSRPLVPNLDDESRALNRRVDIIVTPHPDI